MTDKNEERNSNDDIRIIFGQLTDQAYLMQNAVIGKFNIGFRQRVGYSAETNVDEQRCGERTFKVSLSSPARHDTIF